MFPGFFLAGPISVPLLTVLSLPSLPVPIPVVPIATIAPLLLALEDRTRSCEAKHQPTE